MDNNLILSTCVAVVYFVFKLIETKVIKKEKKEVKSFLKDVIIVFISTFLGGFILTKINTKPMTGGGVAASTQAFIDEPNF